MATLDMTNTGEFTSDISGIAKPTEIEEFPQDLFQQAIKTPNAQQISRPSLSYWQDAWMRFGKNRQSMFSLGLVCFLLLFVTIGPFIWQKDPSEQNINRGSRSPNFGETALVLGENIPLEPTFQRDFNLSNTKTAAELSAPQDFKISDVPNIQNVRLTWTAVEGASGYILYRNEVEPSDGSYGVPVGDILVGNQNNFEDTQSLEAHRYYYTIVAKDQTGLESTQFKTIPTDVVSAIPFELARPGAKAGDRVKLSPTPLGTDVLGRDILARLMSGGQISLFIGVFASFLSVLIGIFIGGIAGFLGGSIDNAIMRFTDLVMGLPFLLFMILLKVVFSVGPGESGVSALLIALVVLSWTSSARLVRGQILQLRDSEFVHAARLMGAKPFYLIVRHMLPNLIGVILVTLTFSIPSAIFTEAFLSFIGLGVAAPATSWGSMCNDGIQTLLTRPYEFFAPAVVISLTVLSFNLLGDGLRDALDPKMRSNE